MSRRPSLGRVLVLSIGGVAVGAVVLTAVMTLGLARLGAPQRAVAQLEREAARVADLAVELPCDVARPRLAEEFGPRVRFVPDGLASRRPVPGPGVTGRTRGPGGESLYASARTTVCGRPGTLYVFERTRDVPAVPEGFTGRLMIAAAFGLTGGTLVAYVLARRMSRPLGELARSARGFGRGTAGGIPAPAPSDPVEIAELKTAFGGMVSDLHAARDREEAFLLSVSHELRTPLTAIRGYGEALADGTARQPRRAGEVVARESKRLERLVQDLLDLARLSAGEFSVHRDNVDLRDVAGSVVDALLPAAKDSDVGLELLSGVASYVETDADRVHQMLANLVENALRVTPERGTVTVEVRHATVAVADSGPGMDADDIDHAFERFYLWRKYAGVRPVGSGLGLAVVGELARLLG
ncbi:MAG: sensor histidine kinase, partial [bacterium]